MFIQIVFWVIFMYGLLSLIQDIATEFTYERFNKNIKVFICIKDFENEFENFEREISRVKCQFKNISINVVNYDESVSCEVLRNFFEGDRVNIYSKEEFLNNNI